jgi:DNA-binding transcriptional MocR family regulator
MRSDSVIGTNQFDGQIDFDGTSPREIAASVARAITSGRIAPGERLPTVRALAEELGVSPATISHAWQALGRAGLIISRGRAGSFVRAPDAEWLPPRTQGLAGHLGDARLDLSRGTPDPLLLPEIGRALSRVSARAGTSSYHDLPVIPELARALRDAWPYETEVITVVDGALDAVSRALESVVRFGDRVAVEVPGFPRSSICSTRSARSVSRSQSTSTAWSPRRSRRTCAPSRAPSCCSRAPRTRRGRR